MRKYLLLILLFTTTTLLYAGQKQIDSLKNALSQASADTSRINLLVELSRKYYLQKPDSGLNLFINSFYALNQKSKTAGPYFKPQITAATYPPPSGGRGAVISTADNGSCIPDAIEEKIMQPSFTTKPTGEGAGSGLSLSYDIVVRGHGGIINVLSEEHEASEFIISLPA